MTQYDWSEAARCLAREVGRSPLLSGWGVARLRLVDDTEPSRFVQDAPVVVAIFGSDAHTFDHRTPLLVERVRSRLAEVAARELGFSLSDHGPSWVLLAGSDSQRYQTAAGQLLQHLLLEAYLEEVIGEACRAVYGLGPDALCAPSHPAGLFA
ncbi:MAG: hypothetical protein L0Z62_09820 [Gemmataceae bacterium]|nr:hypothetical protein [Gemmataceae bacterium]